MVDVNEVKIKAEEVVKSVATDAKEAVKEVPKSRWLKAGAGFVAVVLIIVAIAYLTQ